MRITLNVWRQKNTNAPGAMKRYEVPNVNPDMSFLEMLDVLNEELIEKGDSDGPVTFEHDCREGICGSCGFMINGMAHGGNERTTVCQLHMRHFKDGDDLVLEPWRATAFPILRDLMVDRGAFDRIIASGGYVSVSTGSAPDGNAIAIRKLDSDLAMDNAQCIGCGACVAACPNASASRSARAARTRQEHGRPNEQRALRLLHQHWRVRSGLPQGYPHRVNCPDEPRLLPRLLHGTSEHR
jgi:succinate dehydrogenase / fumarate reductase iron-sulfur subunit